jgi:cyclopropane fatty-acyl-phospholipid synthase-like methyltransferase
MSALEDVREYYDANSARFERFGQGGGTFHRAVWGPGVQSRDEAFRHIDQLILSELELLRARISDPLHVLDLGCGVGSSVIFLASRAKVHATGATLSGVQADRAREHGLRSEVSDRVRFITANFLDLPSTVSKAHVAFSIEAFIHGPDPAEYFRAAARYVVPGGLLVVCDDFLTQSSETKLPPRARRLLEEARKDWLANTLVSTKEASSLASRAGFTLLKDLDLTPHLELRRPRDRAISLLVALGRHLPLRGPTWRSFVGGNALQRALATGLLEYRFLVWQRNHDDVETAEVSSS